jgi:hypothetical protein
MTVSNWITIIAIAAPALATLTFIFIGTKRANWLKIQGVTNDLLREQNTELRSAHTSLQCKYDESLRAISTLQGKVSVLEAIPLQAISETLKEILATLIASSEALKLDTRAALSAVQTVKSDLALHDLRESKDKKQ